MTSESDTLVTLRYFDGLSHRLNTPQTHERYPLHLFHSHPDLVTAGERRGSPRDRPWPQLGEQRRLMEEK